MLKDWNNNEIVISPNPCVNMFGKGPENTTCAECVHLHRYQQAATWYKCDLRPKYKRGLSGDHKVRHPACKRYERRGEDNAKGQAVHRTEMSACDCATTRLSASRSA